MLSVIVYNENVFCIFNIIPGTLPNEFLNSSERCPLVCQSFESVFFFNKSGLSELFLAGCESSTFNQNVENSDVLDIRLVEYPAIF